MLISICCSTARLQFFKHFAKRQANSVTTRPRLLRNIFQKVLINFFVGFLLTDRCSKWICRSKTYPSFSNPFSLSVSVCVGVIIYIFICPSLFLRVSAQTRGDWPKNAYFIRLRLLLVSSIKIPVLIINIFGLPYKTSRSDKAQAVNSEEIDINPLLLLLDHPELNQVTD